MSVVLSVNAKYQEADRQGAEQLIIVQFDRARTGRFEQIVLSASWKPGARPVVVLGDVDSDWNVPDDGGQIGTQSFLDELRLGKDRRLLGHG